MTGSQEFEHLGHPVDELCPTLPTRSDRLTRIDVPVEGAEPYGERIPGQTVGLAGVEFTQPALGDQDGGLVRPVPFRGEGRGHQLGRLDGPGKNAGVEGIGAGQLTGAEQTVMQPPHLLTAPSGETRAPEGASTDA